MDKEKLIRHTKAQKFKLCVWDDDWYIMYYKIFSMYDEWLSKDGILMWKSNVKGNPILRTGDSFPTKPWDMAKLENVIEGL